MICESHMKSDARVRMFSFASEKATADMSLAIMRVAEETVTELGKLEVVLEDVINLGLDAIDQITTCPLAIQIDPSDKIVSSLEAAEQAWETAHGVFVGKLRAARTDSRLAGEHRKSVINAYEKVIALSVQLHDVARDLKWAVMEHDANLEVPTGKLFDSVDEFMADLLGKK